MTREEAIFILRGKRDISGEKTAGALDMAIKALESEPKTGHWITKWNTAHQKEYYYCSECRDGFSYDGETGIKMSDYDYCPNCGAKMVKSQAESEAEE